MASTATTVLRLEKIGSGEKAGTWDDSINTLFDMLDRAHSGIAISTTGGDTTLSNVDYTVDQAKAETLEVSGTLVSNATIIIPNAKKKYIVKNGTSGAFTLSVKTSSGSAITVTQGSTATVYCDGSNGMSYATPQVVSSTGAPTSGSGAVASAVEVTPTGNLAAATAQAAFAELQGDIDTINTSLSNKQPLDADLTAIAALAVTKGNMIAANGTAWTALAVGTNGLVKRANSSAATGMEWAAGVPAGTVCLFQQTGAPTGYTKLTDSNNTALRVVSGNVGAGGSLNFTDVFKASLGVSGTSGSTALTINQIPEHTHTYTAPAGGVGGDGGAGVIDDSTPGTATGSAGGGEGHTHGSGSFAVNLDVFYLDCIRATAS
jgi:hypothetical protein